MIGFGKNKTKLEVEEDSSSRSATPKNSVLNAFNRLKNRRNKSADEDQFGTRLGKNSREISEAISNISDRIDASNAQDISTTASNMSHLSDAVDMSETGGSAETEDAPDGSAQQEHVTTVERPSQRTRVMQFHKPAYSPPKPESAIDPDFSASTLPPDMKQHKAHEGVMPNTGTENYEKQKKNEPVEEPVDPQTFAAQIRAKISKSLGSTDVDPDATDALQLDASALAPEAEIETETQEDQDMDTSANKPHPDADLADDAKAFATDFYTRVSQAHRPKEAEAHAPENAPTDLPPKPAAISQRRATAPVKPKMAQPLIPLRRRAAFPPRPEVQPSGLSEQPQSNPLHAAPLTRAVPVTPNGSGQADKNLTHSPAFIAPDFSSGPPSPDPEFSIQDQGSAHMADQPTSHDFSNPAPMGQASPIAEPQLAAPVQPPEQTSQSMSQTPEPSVSELLARHASTGFETEQIEDAQTPDPDVFAKPDIDEDEDEDELLVKIYDLVQSELNRAWGENIALNIRQIVRDEISAAMAKKRSE